MRKHGGVKYRNPDGTVGEVFFYGAGLSTDPEPFEEADGRVRIPWTNREAYHARVKYEAVLDGKFPSTVEAAGSLVHDVAHAEGDETSPLWRAYGPTHLHKGAINNHMRSFNKIHDWKGDLTPEGRVFRNAEAAAAQAARIKKNAARRRRQAEEERENNKRRKLEKEARDLAEVEKAFASAAAQGVLKQRKAANAVRKAQQQRRNAELEAATRQKPVPKATLKLTPAEQAAAKEKSQAYTRNLLAFSNKKPKPTPKPDAGGAGDTKPSGTT